MRNAAAWGIHHHAATAGIFQGDGASVSSPATDPTLVLWLRKTGPFYANIDGTGGTPADGAATGRWGDSSSSLNHFSAAGNDATRPVKTAGGVTGLTFDGVNDLLLGLASLNMTSAAWTLFVYGSHTNSGSNKGIMGRWGTVNQWGLLGRDFATGANQYGLVRNAANSANYIASAAATGALAVRGMSYEPATTTVRQWLDSTETTATASDIKTGTANVVMGGYQDAATALAQNVYEVMLFTRVMTLAERNTVRSFIVL